MVPGLAACICVSRSNETLTPESRYQGSHQQFCVAMLYGFETASFSFAGFDLQVHQRRLHHNLSPMYTVSPYT